MYEQSSDEPATGTDEAHDRWVGSFPNPLDAEKAVAAVNQSSLMSDEERFNRIFEGLVNGPVSMPYNVYLSTVAAIVEVLDRRG